MTDYFRPLLQANPALRPALAPHLAGGALWFDRCERLQRGKAPEIVPVDSLPAALLRSLTAPRAPLAGLTMDRPRLMGILNVTPDSFSDGGQFASPDAAVAHALQMVSDGADVLDIGGESTRPGAETVPDDTEIQRTSPVIAAIRATSPVPISIDTRKAAVAQAALAAGADIVNDVSALTHDPALADVAAAAQAPICLMHAQGDPATMQQNPRYDDVLLDVYDHLADRIAVAEAAGITRDTIMIDPGIGFGKTLDHNLAILRRISLFHGLGCAILLGASRKRFIGTLGQAPDPAKRAPGSIAVALNAIAQGVQILRVHDIPETRQALALTAALQE